MVVMFLEKLEKFLILILEEEVPNATLLQQDSTSAFLYCSSVRTFWVVFMGLDWHR
jgi:hypothetical protein